MHVVHGNLNWGTLVGCVMPGWLEVKDRSIVDGRPMVTDDYRAAAKVALVGQTAALNLFGDVGPIGRTIRIQHVPFMVIGLLGRKGPNTWGHDQDDTVMVPLSTARQKPFGRIPGKARAIWAITVKVWEGEDLDAARAELDPIEALRHE